MVKLCLTIEDRVERQICAQSIIRVMANIGQEKLSNPEVQIKLWNHLALMSSYQLDIDYPVEIISQKEATSRPLPMPIPQGKIKHRHYGYIIEEALRKLKEMPEGEERDALVCQTADRMKQNLFTWTPDIMSEEKVKNDIDIYTTGKSISEVLQGHKYATLHTLPTNVLKKKKKK
jgi:hypothetical protein